VTSPAGVGQVARRARPLLGTLVEVGVVQVDWSHAQAPALVRDTHDAHDAAFAAIAEVQSQLSRFDPASNIGWFNGARARERRAIGPHTQAVLAAARRLRDATGDLFDITLGTGPRQWRLEGGDLVKLHDGVSFDLGGIGKGYAVDRAIEALMAAGCPAGWVNAGGDLRAFGDIDVPVTLRDECGGGVRPFAQLRDGAIATSRFGRGAQSELSAPHAVDAHVSVAAPLCLWADALTKLVALSGDTAHPLLAAHEAQAWLH
jgi:thiamine biosynthesis lipoprotein